MRPLHSRHLNAHLALHLLHSYLKDAGVLPDVLFHEADPDKVSDLPGYSLMEKVNPSPLNWHIPEGTTASAATVLWLELDELHRRYPMCPPSSVHDLFKSLGQRFPATRWFGARGQWGESWTDTLLSTLLVAHRVAGGELVMGDRDIVLTTDKHIFSMRSTPSLAGTLSGWLRLPPTRVFSPLAQAVQSIPSHPPAVNMMLRSLAGPLGRATLEDLTQVAAGQSESLKTRKVLKQTIRYSDRTAPRVAYEHRDNSEIDVESLLEGAEVDMWALREALVPSALTASEFSAMIGPGVKPGTLRKVSPGTKLRWAQRIRMVE